MATKSWPRNQEFNIVADFFVQTIFRSERSKKIREDAVCIEWKKRASESNLEKIWLQTKKKTSQYGKSMYLAFVYFFSGIIFVSLQTNEHTFLTKSRVWLRIHSLSHTHTKRKLIRCLPARPKLNKRMLCTRNALSHTHTNKQAHQHAGSQPYLSIFSVRFGSNTLNSSWTHRHVFDVMGNYTLNRW